MTRSPRLKLISSPKPDYNLDFEIPPGRSIFVGRRTSCDVVIEDPMIAPVHCLVTLMPKTLDRLVLVDLGGTNGTWIGDKKISVEILKSEDEFSIAGKWRFKLVCV